LRASGDALGEHGASPHPTGGVRETEQWIETRGAQGGSALAGPRVLGHPCSVPQLLDHPCSVPQLLLADVRPGTAHRLRPLTGCSKILLNHPRFASSVYESSSERPGQHAGLASKRTGVADARATAADVAGTSAPCAFTGFTRTRAPPGNRLQVRGGVSKIFSIVVKFQVFESGTHSLLLYRSCHESGMVKPVLSLVAALVCAAWAGLMPRPVLGGAPYRHLEDLVDDLDAGGSFVEIGSDRYARGAPTVFLARVYKHGAANAPASVETKAYRRFPRSANRVPAVESQGRGQHGLAAQLCGTHGA